MENATPIAKPAADKFTQGLLLGLAIGAVSGWVLSASSATAPSAPPPSLAPVVDSGSMQQAAEALAAQLPVTLGRGSREYGRTAYPIMIENKTGRALGYLQADCRFFSKSGGLVASEMTNWTDVAAGETVSGEIRVEAPDGDKYECTARSSS